MTMYEKCFERLQFDTPLTRWSCFMYMESFCSLTVSMVEQDLSEYAHVNGEFARCHELSAIALDLNKPCTRTGKRFNFHQFSMVLYHGSSFCFSFSPHQQMAQLCASSKRPRRDTCLFPTWRILSLATGLDPKQPLGAVFFTKRTGFP